MYDVVVIGGGPAGSTLGSMLRTYDKDISVLILERDSFPRDHVGESQLPIIGAYLDEIGVWDKIEAANFPIKVGATYRWGLTPDLWNFEFLPNAEFDDQPRPGKYEGQRLRTAFQVDRAVYDDILLRHAAELGCEVRERCRVLRVNHDGDTISGLEVVGEDGAQVRIEANWYIDASGVSATIRKAMEIGVSAPTTLRNVAVWDYWQNADWAVEIGIGGTRIQVLSLGYGWIWFIPLSPTRTSVGLVVPAAYLKTSGKKAAELYAEAIAAEPRVVSLMRNATSEGQLQTTNDWSYIADRLCGSNWFLIGDACGFADPILSAGMTLAHTSGREVAHAILEMRRSPANAEWLRSAYTEVHKRRIWQHIRFADYWYGANAQFSELVAYCSEIAKDSGLNLAPDQAFQWLGTGGFANDDIGQASVGAYSLSAVKRITAMFGGKSVEWKVNQATEVRLVLAGVKVEESPHYHKGQVERVKTLVRENRRLPLTGPFRVAYAALQLNHDLRKIGQFINSAAQQAKPADRPQMCAEVAMAIEAMIAEGWAKAKTDKGKPVGFGILLGDGAETIRLDSKQKAAELA